MSAQAQMQALAQPLPMRSDGKTSVKDFFFAPIRFCGRQWVWIRNDQNDQTSQIALKVLALPFLACATLLSGAVAAVGALAFSPDRIPGCFDYSKIGDLNLLRRDTSNDVVGDVVEEELNIAGCECSVEVESMDREILHNYYPDHIHRNVTLRNASSTAVSRIWEVVKYHFSNKNIASLYALYPCIYGGGSVEAIDRLNSILAIHKGVTFSMAFDLAYVRTDMY